MAFYFRRLITKDDFDYAIENTHVIVAPEQQIATFGSTSFKFFLISELMDRVDQVRIRNGKIHAERPQILTPEHYSRLLVEGFGEKAQRYVDQLREHVENENEPLSAVIQGVDDAWEVCLLKFTIDLIERSSGGNVRDFRKRGLM